MRVVEAVGGKVEVECLFTLGKMRNYIWRHYRLQPWWSGNRALILMFNHPKGMWKKIIIKVASPYNDRLSGIYLSLLKGEMNTIRVAFKSIFLFHSLELWLQNTTSSALLTIFYPVLAAQPLHTYCPTYSIEFLSWRAWRSYNGMLNHATSHFPMQVNFVSLLMTSSSHLLCAIACNSKYNYL